jgi:hypothetical protein
MKEGGGKEEGTNEGQKKKKKTVGEKGRIYVARFSRDVSDII